MNSSTTFSLSSVKPNPFRHMDRYPIQERKIKALRESIQTTGFWDNLVARIGPDGKPQIAYGHHRWQTLLDMYPPGHKINLIIRDLSDDQMLKIMARENMEEWGSSAPVEQETVRAVVEAYADGLIELGELPSNMRNDQLRYAPDFTQGERLSTDLDAPYSVRQIVNYLGWSEEKVGYALGALELINEGALTESDFDGLGTKAAIRVVEEARKARRERENRERQLRKEAEAAQRAAEKAKADRARAEAEAAKRKEQAAKALQNELRRKREREAREAEARAKKAEAERDRQEKEREKKAREADAAREQARKNAGRAGKEASEGLKGGKKGVNDPNLVTPNKGEKPKPPPNINKFTQTVAGRLNKILDPQFDAQARNLDQILKFKEHLNKTQANNLDAVLSNIIERAAEARRRLNIDLRDVIDGEVVKELEAVK